MCLLRQIRRLALALTLCLASGMANVANYAEYDAPARIDGRRGQEGLQMRRYPSAGSSRQLGAPQTYYQRPGGGAATYDQQEAEAPQPMSREYMMRAHESIANREQHKCRIWVPPEVVDKYPDRNFIQTDVANKLSSIEICCTGYRTLRLKGVTLCLPICGCANGGCRVPGECDCYEGFVKSDNGDCVFACPLGCLNGRCFLDGSCQCDPGYTLDETRRFCRPICSGGCGSNPRHNCSEPEVCSCAKGYQLTDNGCQPSCDPDCGVGGICQENNECNCGPGYTLKDGVCQADCYQKCDNGICVSRNRCICDPGYTYHEQSTMCVLV
ncbi:hypothetical protein KR222_009187 [Zaprionus bogoriensis]|nr:hypothetical protein KR222_009187 [Zaprionus bogoriensis]